MGITNAEELKKLIIKSLKITLSQKEIIKNSKDRSSIFVSKIGKELGDLYSDGTSKYVDFNIEKTKRIPGEWLLDVVILKGEFINDPKFKTEKPIYYHLTWAVESETGTSLKEFAEDFGKLLCVRTDNALFLGGLDQKNEKSRKDYIKRRLEATRKVIGELGDSNTKYYLAFWPSPSNKKGKSLWDQDHEKLIEMVEVYEL